MAHRKSHTMAVVGLGLVAASCGGGEVSVSLLFPNSIAETSVRRLRVEAYSPDTGAAAATERDCGDFRGLAREGKDPIGTPVYGDYQCLEPCEPDWMAALELEKVPSGRQIIYVLAYGTTEEDATPVLEGCTDRFDSTGGGDERKEVEIPLELVIPDSARLVKTAGDRQVGRAGEELSVPLEVRVEADSPRGTGGTYPIPGVPISFASEREGFSLVGDMSTFTNRDGRADIGVELPATPGSGEIVANASELEVVASGDRATQTFSVSVTEPVVMSGTDALDLLPGARPVAVALGSLGGGPDLDAVVLGCMAEAEVNCSVGHAAVPPFGQTALAVALDVGATPSFPSLSLPPGGLGILPADLVVGDVASPAGRDELAFVNSRRADCQARGCEGSEILIMSVANGQVSLIGEGRQTMTGSNAVSLSTFKATYTAFDNLAIAAQGRSVNTQVCSQTPRCLPVNELMPEIGGCPPGERCECPGCPPGTNEPGVCVARDKMVDVLVSKANQIVNHNGCQMPMVACDNTSPEQSTCACLDTFRGNKCIARDGCNCKVPDRVHIGEHDSPVLPFSLIAGPLKSAEDWDIVVPSIGGLEMIEARPSQETFLWMGAPIINVPIHAAQILDLDYASEEDNNDPHRGDVVWYSRAPCLAGPNFQTSCPVWRGLPEGQEPVGCLGVYYTDGQDSVFDLRTPRLGGCRRHHLDFAPDGMCAGEFNGDGHIDVALATRERAVVYIYSGDGRGCLLDPPEEVPIPASGVGGPIACGDVDGDGRDDVVVANQQNAAIYLLRTGG